jgi:hypothetical protein
VCGGVNSCGTGRGLGGLLRSEGSWRQGGGLLACLLCLGLALFWDREGGRLDRMCLQLFTMLVGCSTGKSWALCGKVRSGPCRVSH